MPRHISYVFGLFFGVVVGSGHDEEDLKLETVASDRGKQQSCYGAEISRD